MKIPNAADAFIDMAKVIGYCLKHKAFMFASVLGITQQNAEVLYNALMQIIRAEEAQIGELDESGQRYIIDFQMTTETGTAIVRSAWIIRTAEIFPRFVSAYIMG